MKKIFLYAYKETIGDSIAWIPAFNEFQKKNNCELYVCINNSIKRIVEKQYSNIHFIKKEEIKKYKFEESFDVVEYEAHFTENGLQEGVIFFIDSLLSVNSKNKIPKFDLSAKRKIKEPYVCISIQASNYIKLWNYPNGWDFVINYLKDFLRYKVFCIDKNNTETYFPTIIENKEKKKYIIEKKIPNTVIDDTGYYNLQRRIDLIKDADFFIGLSSGLSWLARGCKVPVVLISGFTKPENEFPTSYRVYPNNECRFCNFKNISKYNEQNVCDSSIKINDEPIQKCSMNITPQMIIDTINKIPCAKEKIIKKYRNE